VKDAVGFKLRPLRGGEYFEGGIGMAMFGHRPPMPKSRGGGKRCMGGRAPTSSPHFVMLNLFQHLTFQRRQLRPWHAVTAGETSSA
jgi:hypothetical protein